MADSQISAHWTLAALSEYFSTYNLSKEQIFSPYGDWQQTYAQWLLLPGWSPPSKGQAVVVLNRQRVYKTYLELTVTKDILTIEGSSKFHRQSLTMTCNPSQLVTPIKWVRRSCLYYSDGRPIENGETSMSGEVKNGEICRSDSKQRIKAPKTFTSNWSLFDVLQRTPLAPGASIDFTMIEDMDIIKPEQKLTYIGEAEIEAGGRKIKLHGFEQIGQGILPQTYWLDEQHRLIAAITGMFAYLYDPSAKLREVKDGK